MAKNRSPQPGKTKSAGNPKTNNKPNPKKQAPKKRSASADPLAEAPSAGDAVWYLVGLLCTGAIIFALLFVSVVGGENYEGPKQPPKPPINHNIPTPNLDDAQDEDEEEEDISSPQPDSPTPPADQTPAQSSPAPAP